MNPTEAQIQQRMPVWVAFADLFLDDELTAADFQRIATTLAQSAFSEEELLEILTHEVYPVCSPNLRSVAGVWGAWDEAWLRANIVPRFGQRHSALLQTFRQREIAALWQSVAPLVKNVRSAE